MRRREAGRSVVGNDGSSALCGAPHKAELRADFDSVSEERYARIVDSGKSIAWNEMRVYLEQRLAGNSVKRPPARKLAR